MSLAGEPLESVFIRTHALVPTFHLPSPISGLRLT